MKMETNSWLESIIDSNKENIDFKYEGIVLAFTETVLSVMEKNGMNRKHLAKKLDVSPSYVTKLLNGTNMTIRQMLRVCEVVTCELEVNIKVKKEVDKSNVIDLRAYQMKRGNEKWSELKEPTWDPEQYFLLQKGGV